MNSKFIEYYWYYYKYDKHNDYSVVRKYILCSQVWLLYRSCQHGHCGCWFAFWLLYHHQQHQHFLYQDHCQHRTLPLSLHPHIIPLSVLHACMYFPSLHSPFLCPPARPCWWRGVACWSAIPFHDCCVAVSVSRLPLPLPLSDRILIAIVRSRSGCNFCCCVFQLHLKGRTCWQCSW